jgi:PAS domain S-box-containing protein
VSQRLKILCLEDEPHDVELMQETLASDGLVCDLVRVETQEDFATALAQDDYNLIFSDKTLPAYDGLSALALARDKRPEVPFIFVSGTFGEEVAIDTLKNGATDYVLKQRLARLPSVTRRALREVAEKHERKLVEQEVRNSEKRFRALIENSADGIALVNALGTIVYTAPSMLRLLGYTDDEFVGRDLFGLIHPDDQPMAAGLFADLLQVPGRIVNGQCRVLHRDGTWRWIETTGTNLLQEPSVTAVVANLRDVTARKRAEEALRQSEEKYRLLVEQIHDVIYAVDERGVITYMSPSVEAYTGYTPAELVGREFTPLIYPDDLSSVLADFANSLGGKSEPLEYRVIDKAGAIHWAHSYAYPITHAGRIVGVQGVLSDVTIRKRAEEALRLQSAALNAAANAIVITDRDGTIEWVNPAFTTITRYIPEETTGKNMRDLVQSGKHGPDFYKGFWATILAGKTWHGEMINRRKDGSLYPEEQTITSLKNADGAISHFIAIKQDISERKQAEEAMHRRLAELEALHTVSAALRMAETQDEALPILLDESLAALETDAGAIWLYHAEHGELRAAVARGWFQPLGQSPMKPGEGIAGSVFAGGQTYLSAEFRSDPLARAATHGQVPPNWGGVCLPIRSGPLTVGVLFVSVPLPRHITTQQIKLLESLTEMGGAAVQRMSLYEETTSQLERLQALHIIDLAISSSMDLRMTLTILLEHVKTQLNVDATDVLLLNPSMLTLEYAAGTGFRRRVDQAAHIRLGESFAGRAALERRAVQANDIAHMNDNPPFAALWAGEQFAAYYGVPLIAKGKVKGVLEVFHRAPFQPGPSWISFLETLAGQAAIAIDNAQLFENLQRSNVDLALAYDATIEGWSRALDLRDKETEGHTQRVTETTERLALVMGLSGGELVHIRRGALLHDIGKMGVPDTILFKPGPLTDAEWVVMRKHPQYAYDMLSPIAYLRPALDIPYCHHEMWDGTGYPRGLKGEQIPLVARIFAVVDVWDALRSDRPYRPAWPEGKVRDHIRSLAGTHFDPRAVEAFWQVVTEEV